MLDQHPVVYSSIPGRIRLRSPLLKERSRMEKTAEAFRKKKGVRSVEENLRTGSLLVQYDREMFSDSALERWLEEQLPAQQAQMAQEQAQFHWLTLSTKQKRHLENRAMMVFGATSLLASFVGRYGLHTNLGWAFVVASVLHTWRYRKLL